MSEPKPRRGRKPKPPLRAKSIEGLKYFKSLRGLLESLHAHKACANRKLHYDELAMLLLLYFFNPALTSLRGVQQASGLRNVQKKLGVTRASLGSLSEAARVFDPALLREVAGELTARVAAADMPDWPRGLSADLDVVAVDGTLLDALPRMAWALWLDEEHRAAKLHLELDLGSGGARALGVTDGNANEKEVLRKSLQAGKLYVLDAGYVKNELFHAMLEAGCSFLVRLKSTAAYETIEERELTEADRAAGVIFDRLVRLGSRATRDDLPEPVRLLRVRGRDASRRGRATRKAKASPERAEEFLLVTDQMDPPAESLALLYGHRWLVELFFRWFKCTLGFGHLLFESPEGVEILVYCALIASMVITLWTGCKPTKRTLEMLQLYLQGWAELDELEAHIANLKPASD